MLYYILSLRVIFSLRHQNLLCRKRKRCRMKAWKAQLKPQVRSTKRWRYEKNLASRLPHNFFFSIQESVKSGKKIPAGAVSIFPGSSTYWYHSQYHFIVCIMVPNQSKIMFSTQITACSVLGMTLIHWRTRRTELQLPPNGFLQELVLVEEE